MQAKYPEDEHFTSMMILDVDLRQYGENEIGLSALQFEPFAALIESHAF